MSIGTSAASPAEASAVAPAASAAAGDARALAALAAVAAQILEALPLRFGIELERHTLFNAVHLHVTSIVTSQVTRELGSYALLASKRHVTS